MNFRTSALLVAPLAAAALATTAHAAAPTAAPKPLVLTDQAGDANALNDQGVLVDSPAPEGTKTDPASAAQYDIKTLTVAATGNVTSRKVRGKVVKTFNCTGYTATLELSGAPMTTAALYRVQGSRVSKGESDTFWLQWNHPAGGTSTTTLRFTIEDPITGTTTKSVPLKNAAKVDGTKVIFTVTAADLAQAGEKLGKLVIAGWGADVRANTGVVTAPMFDQLPKDGAQLWKVCPA